MQYTKLNFRKIGAVRRLGISLVYFISNKRTENNASERLQIKLVNGKILVTFKSESEFLLVIVIALKCQ